MRIRPIFAWFDLWVGLFIDRRNRKVYFFPVPCLGLVFSWGPRLKLYDPKQIHFTMHGKDIRISDCITTPDHLG